MALRPGDKVKAYIQRAHNFALPADGDTPIVTVGPGTGVAPFCRNTWPEAPRARPGSSLAISGATRIFSTRTNSRDSRRRARFRSSRLPGRAMAKKKVYVQDRMREEVADLWSWLGKGAHFYVCGDAKRMAADVDATFDALRVKITGTSPGPDLRPNPLER
jgi:sulfite reductase (NADPH) flavoprotein alpha-component